MRWDLKVGDRIVRKHLHDQYGGQRQGGIATPSGAPHIFIFTDPTTGEQHGYFDEWRGNELHYCGEGQPHHGDQQMDRGNRAILEHEANGKTIRAFYGSKGTVTYAGEFALAHGPDRWYYIDVDAPGGGTRRVIRFRLMPLGFVDQVEPTGTRPLIVPLQPLQDDYVRAEPSPVASGTPFEVDPDAVDRALAGHANTQNALANLAAAHGCETKSPGFADPNFDLAWRRPDGSVVVVEVKSLTDTNELGQVRLGLGQVLDYAHQLRETEPSVTAALALEKQPLSDRWIHVCADNGVTLVWPGTFEALF